MAGTLKACRRQRDNKIKRDVKQLVFVQVAIRPHFSVAPYLPVGGLFWRDQKQNPAKRLWWWLGKSQVCVLFLAQNSAGNSTSLRARPCISDQTVNFLLQVQFDFLLLFSLICYDPATCEVLGDRKKKKKDLELGLRTLSLRLGSGTRLGLPWHRAGPCTGRRTGLCAALGVLATN